MLLEKFFISWSSLIWSVATDILSSNVFITMNTIILKDYRLMRKGYKYILAWIITRGRNARVLRFLILARTLLRS